MADPRDKPSDDKTPDLDNVEPGSDADETPVPEVGETPPDPNKKTSGD